MSNSSNRPGFPRRISPATALAALALIALSATGATLATGAVGLNSAAVGLPEKDKPITKAQAPASLRCWQYGRLLFEETGISAQHTALANAHSWARTGNPEQSLHLITLGDALCLYKSPSPSP